MLTTHHLKLYCVLTSGESGVVYKGYIDRGSGRELVAIKTVKGIVYFLYTVVSSKWCSISMFAVTVV